MDHLYLLWPSEDMDFWKIENEQNKVLIKWSRNYFEDYKQLAFNFYECGVSTFYEVIRSGHDNNKSDMWFLTGIFLVRQSIELGLKSLLCRAYIKNSHIQKAFIECCHNLSLLFQKYTDIGNENYLTNEEIEWMTKYLNSLEEVDSKSDMFRFPFEDEFLSKYQDKFLDNVNVGKNLLQAFALVKKCIQEGSTLEENDFDNTLQPQFFIFASHGIGNCYLWQDLSDNGFHVKVTGYSAVIDYIYKNSNISNETKFYPLMFMFRNTIELCLKRLFYSSVKLGVPWEKFHVKRRSHLIKKDLWKNVKPVISEYTNYSGNNTNDITIVEKMIEEISCLDKNGDNFRYPTSYSLDYRFDNKSVDIKNVYEYLKAMINFFDTCDFMLDTIVDCQNEINENMDWYQ